MNLQESILNVTVELQKSTIKKSGLNKYAGFKYYELADFLPKLNELLLKYKVLPVFNLCTDTAILTLYKGEEKVEYKMPFVQSAFKGMNDIQMLGATNTYYKRYLYLNAFSISDGEVIDALPQSEKPQKKTLPDNKVETVAEWMVKQNKSIQDVLQVYSMSDEVKTKLTDRFTQKLGFNKS